MDGSLAENGYQALFEFDTAAGNRNGFIDAGDAIFNNLSVWKDINQNGVSEPGELLSLDELGIFAISVEFHVSLEEDRHGNELRFFSTAYIRDRHGKARKIDTVDVFFLLKQE